MNTETPARKPIHHDRLLRAAAILLVALLVFQAGNLFGYHRAQYSIRWNMAMMGEPGARDIFRPIIHDGDGPNPHGAIGEVISVNLPTLMVKSPNNVESLVYVSGTTTVRYERSAASSTDIKVGSPIVVVGEPRSSNAIQAIFIRILPALPTPPAIPRRGPGMSSSTSSYK